MGRKAIIFGFWLLGFALGFFGYFILGGIGRWLMMVLPQLFTSEQVVGAFLSGIAGSVIMIVAVITWSYLSR